MRMEDVSLCSELYTNSISRNRSIRFIWKSSGRRRPGLITNSLLSYRYNVILYGPSFRRDGRRLPRGWIILSLLDTFPRSCMGICYGMELRSPMASRATPGNRLRIHHDRLLGFRNLKCPLGSHLPGSHRYNQYVRSQGLWRSRIRLCDSQSRRHCWIYVSLLCPYYAVDDSEPSVLTRLSPASSV